MRTKRTVYGGDFPFVICSFSCRPDLRDRAQRMADARGVKFSEYMRQLLVEDIKRNKGQN